MVLLLALNVLELTYDMPAIQPSLRDLGHAKLAPALKRRAIFRHPSGMMTMKSQWHWTGMSALRQK